MGEPGHREILWTPWRHEYIKSGGDRGTGECVFCAAISKGISVDSLVLATSKYSAIILNKYPYNNGHAMVIPKSHTHDLASLSIDEYDDLHAMLKRLYLGMQKAYNPHGMNLGMNLGKTGGAGIADHLHYHLLPRWNGDTNFMPLIAKTKVISETLEQTYQRLLPYLRDGK